MALLTNEQKIAYCKIIAELRAQPDNRPMSASRIKRIETALVKLGFTKDEVEQDDGALYFY